jgi:hypothetical protein
MSLDKDKSASQATVLVVDDNRDTVDILTLLLVRHDMTVLCEHMCSHSSVFWPWLLVEVRLVATRNSQTAWPLGSVRDSASAVTVPQSVA